MTNVYILDSDTHDYAAFMETNDDDSARIHDGFRGLAMTPGWTPMTVERLVERPADRDLPTGDFPTFGAIPLLSARAADALADLLEGRGELLPVISEQGEFHALNVTRLSDALDEQRTTFERFSDGGVMDIESYEFIADRLADETIFKLPAVVAMYEYVTDVFVERVRERGLEGFRFQQVWPHPGH